MGAARQRTQSVTWSGQQVASISPGTDSTWSVQEITEAHDGYWTVRDVETGIFGSGSDEGAAREDFEQALREHQDVLSRQEQLSKDLVAQLAYLRWRLS